MVSALRCSARVSDRSHGCRPRRRAACLARPQRFAARTGPASRAPCDPALTSRDKVRAMRRGALDRPVGESLSRRTRSDACRALSGSKPSRLTRLCRHQSDTSRQRSGGTRSSCSLRFDQSKSSASTALGILFSSRQPTVRLAGGACNGREGQRINRKLVTRDYVGWLVCTSLITSRCLVRRSVMSCRGQEAGVA